MDINTLVMKRLIQKGRSISFYFLAFSFLLAITASCSKIENPDNDETQEEVEEYVVETEDKLTVTSDLGAYVYPHNYEGFGLAFTNRLKNKVPVNNFETAETVATLVIHSSQLKSMGDDIGILVSQLAMGYNVVIIEPTLESFRYFCSETTYWLQEVIKVDDELGLNLELDFFPGLRQTFEGFYEMSKDDSKIESLFISDSDSEGVFAEAIAVRGCHFHIVDRMVEVTDVKTTIDRLDLETKETSPYDDPDIDLPEEGIQNDVITPYSYGIFADVLTTWVNEQKDYLDEIEELSTRGANLLETRSGTTQYNLKDISTVQKVEYTFQVPTPLSSSSPLPVSVSFEICSAHMQGSDYYCIYKKITSFNQKLNCGPNEPRSWREDDRVNHSKYYGPFMRNIETLSFCHTDNRYANSEGIIEIPSDKSVTNVVNATIEKYSPTNSVGSTTESTGITFGFSGGVCIGEKPSVNCGFNFSWNSSNLRSVTDLEIEASSYNGRASWKYIGQNLPEPFYNAVKTNSHSFAPSIMRTECVADQSWVLRVPNPSGSYCLYDQTKVTTSIMYYTRTICECHANYKNNDVEKRVSFRLAPPPRYVQKWAMHVEHSADEEGASNLDSKVLDEEIQTMHPDYWIAEGADVQLPDASIESRVTITEFINNFKSELNNKLPSWRRKNLYGTFTFTFINHDFNDEYKITFQVDKSSDE